MSNLEIPKISKLINSDNYFLNCYANLTKRKEIHFLFILIEILLNIFYELEIFIRGFQYQEIAQKTIGLNILSSITKIFRKIPGLIAFIILIIFIAILDSLAFFIKIKKFKKSHIRITILIDILEILCFRTLMLLFFNFHYLI